MLGTTRRTVSTWRGRFVRDGLAGLGNKPHPGPAPTYGAETGRRILEVLDREPPMGFARWTGSLIATELGECMSSMYRSGGTFRRHRCDARRPKGRSLGRGPAPLTIAFILCADRDRIA